MKKLLLLWMVAMLAAVNLYAEEEGGMGKWQKTFTPVADAKDMGDVHLAQAGDGSVYVVSKQDQNFTFAGKTATGSGPGLVIVKYDQDGNELWSTPLWGAVTITCMTADTDGTLYVAGNFTDEVELIYYGDALARMKSEDAYSAFVGRVNKDGGFDNVKVFKPTPDTSVTENYEGGYFYWNEDPLFITPNNIQVDGDKVYVSAKYVGDVTDLGWKGAYVNVDGLATDVMSYGVFSLNKSTFDGVTSEAVLRQTEEVPMGMSQPDAFNFAVQSGVLYMGFFVYGDVTLSTASAGSKNFSYARGEAESGDKQHALVVAMVTGSDIKVKDFPTTTMHSYEALGVYSLLRPVVSNNMVYIAGSFIGEFPIDPSVNNDFQTSFLIALNLLQGKPDWVITSPVEAKAVKPIAMVVTGDEIHLATDKGLISVETNSGKFDTEKMLVADGDAYEDTYAAIAMVDDNSVIVVAMNMDGGGEEHGDYVSFGHWDGKFKPVSDSGKLGTPCTAVGLDGSVYASSHWNTAFEFGGKNVPDPEIGGSSVIVRYDKDGKEQWALTLEGAATVTAMTADMDGTLYAAGYFVDKVTLNDGSTLNGNDTDPYGFILKIGTDGKVQAQQIIITAAPTEPAEYWGDLQFYPNKLMLDNKKLYVLANFKGEVESLGWHGSYANYYWGMAYVDNRSAGIFTLNTADLMNPTSVAVLQPTEPVFDGEEGLQCYADAVDFVVQNRAVMLGFVGFGNLTLTTPQDSKDYSFEMQGEGMNEHAFVGVAIEGGKILKPQANDGIYHAAPHSSFFADYSLKGMYIDGQSVYVAGTCYGNFWFDQSVSQDKNYAFIASFNMQSGELNWTRPLEVESYGTALGQEGGNVMASTNVGTFLIGTDGNIMTDKTKMQKLDALASFMTATNAYVYADGMNVRVFGRYNAEEAEKILTGIEQPKAGAAKLTGVRYNLAGQKVDANYKGVVITSEGKKYYVK